MNDLRTKGLLGSITGVTCDSRKVKDGFAFVAIKGLQVDGRLYVREAVKRGAKAIIVEDPLVLDEVEVIQVTDARAAYAEVAKRFYGEPDQRLIIVAITGTNGKTTVSKMVQYILTQHGHKVGYIGTLGYEVGDVAIKGDCTTPDAEQLYCLLRQMVDGGCTHVIMEVSSHGLHQKRVYGLDVDVAAFTNLSQDHLDYHDSMDDYFESKTLLFDNSVCSVPKVAVINATGEYGKAMAKRVDTQSTLLTIGEGNASMVWGITEGDERKSFFSYYYGGEQHGVQLPLVGAYNVENALVAIGIALSLGLGASSVNKSLESFPGVKGRLEAVDLGQEFSVFVDFAHTPDALINVLKELRRLVSRQLFVVFGCGGNRDREKRPLMMAAVCRFADRVFATADNSRDESIVDIFRDMKEGEIEGVSVLYIPDRKQAISKALYEAQAGDCVLIAGKGHETYQEMCGTRVPFDDSKIAQSVLKGRVETNEKIHA